MHYSTEQRRSYITNTFENDRIFLNEDLREVLGFKDRIIKVIFSVAKIILSMQTMHPAT